MNTITHYEVYQANGGQWAMVARFARAERDVAFLEVRRIEDDPRSAAAVIEENENLASGHFDVRLIHRSMAATADIRAPAGGSDLGSRLFMVALNALTIGAIAMILAALGLTRASLTPGWFNIALFGAFLGGTLVSGLLLFRVYIPVGVILWRAKDPDSRRRTITALTQGRVVASASEAAAAPEEPPLPPPPMAPEPVAASSVQAMAATPVEAAPTLETPPAEMPASAETMEPAASTPAEAPPPVEATPAPAAAPVSLTEEARAALLELLKPPLLQFTEGCLATLVQSRPTMTPADRLGFQLYLLGAATTVTDRNSLDGAAARVLTESMLVQAQMTPEDIAAFFAALDGAGDRPRYKRMVEDGKAAMVAHLGDAPAAPLPTITELLIRWSDPAQKGADTQQMTFLLTDMVGSTAMTSEIGNAGAQRVLRAHNTIVRAAAKAFRGREVKHTGDGMLLIFPDSTAGARAAMDIQQEATNFAKDNPTAPLALRVGLHTGEAVFEDGEYYGPAVAIVGGLCGMVNAEEICCSIVVRHKVPSSFKFEDLGARMVKGATGPLQLFKLLWEPKRVNKKPALEYRQIGATPAGVPIGPESQ